MLSIANSKVVTATLCTRKHVKESRVRCSSRLGSKIPRTRIPGPNAGTGSEFSDTPPNHSAKQTPPKRHYQRQYQQASLVRHHSQSVETASSLRRVSVSLQPQTSSTPSSCLHKSSRQALMICPCMAHPFPTQHRAAPPRTSSMSDGQENGVTP